MASKGDTQLETSIDHALRRQDFHPLEGLLQKEPSAQKCSKQLIGKLHRLLCLELDRQEVKNVSLVLNVIYKFGKCMNTSGEEWLNTALNQGLVEKMIIWFDKTRDILARGGKARNESLVNLAEDFFEVLMTIYDHNHEGKMQVSEHFIARTCSLISDPYIHVLIKQEVVRKLNLMLDRIPQDARKTFLHSEKILSIISSMGKIILDAGDYDLQIAITEALCRMTSEKQRGDLASQWFPMGFVTDAFKAITDSEFETDCRKFLNLVNGMLGNKRSVFTYPCLSAYLDNHKLQAPSDEKLEEFWIDFNTSTESISFYISVEEYEDQQWETVYVAEREVNVFSVQGSENKLLLTINLNNSVTIGNKAGSRIRIYFDSMLDIADAAQRVYGVNKLKVLTKKSRCSVSKTNVQIIFDESGSQIVIPESQDSVCSKRFAEPSEAKKLSVSTSSVNQHIEEKEDATDHSKLETPSNKRKVSEATVIIPVANSHKQAKPPAVTVSPKKQKMRVKPPLEMISSAERSTVSCSSIAKKVSQPIDKIENVRHQKIKPGKESEMMRLDEYVQGLDGEEKIEIVPDTQPMSRRDTEIFPTVNYKNKHKPDSTKTQSSFRSRKTKVSKTNHYISNQEPIPEYKSHVDQRHAERKKRENDCQDQSSRPEGSVKSTEHRVHNEVSRTGARSHVSSESTRTDTDRKELTRLPGSKQTGFPPANARDALKEKHEKEKVTQSLISKIGSKYSEALAMKKQGEMTLSVKKLKLQANQEKGNYRRSSRQKAKQLDESVEKDDIYSFQFRGSDDPIIHLGVASTVSSTENRTKLISTEKRKPAEKDQAGVKKKCKGYQKHLFSDTDTDRGGDESKTDMSWIRNWSSEKKPKIVPYSRQKQEKAAEEASHHKCQDTYKTKPKERKKAIKDPLEGTTNIKAPNPEPKNTKNKRPRRAALIKKSYKELSSSEHESAEDTTSPSLSKAHARPPPLAVENQKRPENPNTTKPQKRHQRTEPKTANQKTEASPYLGSVAEHIPLSPSPPSIEKNRSDGYVSPIDQANVRSSSPSLSASPPEKQTPLVSRNLSSKIFFSSEVWTWNRQPDKSAEEPLKLNEKAKSMVRGPGTKHCSPASNMASLPSSGGGIHDEFAISGFNIQLSAKKRAKKGGGEHVESISTDGSGELEPNPDEYKQSRIQFRSPTSGQSDSSSSRRRRLSSDMFKNNTEKTGPVTSNRKRMLDGSHDVSPKGTEDQIKRRKAKLLPRKLFANITGEDLCNRESLSTVSGNDLSTGATDTWDGNTSSIGVMCQQIGKEFTRKIQSRSRKMDYFTKQSLKSAQKHLTSVNVQVLECRMKQLDRFQQAILEEIENFEKDSLSLKNLEKDFTTFWTQQMQRFILYRKSEQKRIQTLRSSLEKNVYQRVNYEENIFSSEMTLLKDGMKHFQESLLKEMQEEELLNVRRGLQTLFMAGARNL